MLKNYASSPFSYACKNQCCKLDVHESVRRDIIMNSTNEMQLYRLIYYYLIRKYVKYMVGTQLYIIITQISTYSYMFRPCILVIVRL